VKKVGPIKIIHDQFRAKKSHDARQLWESSFIAANRVHKEVGVLMNNILDDLNPLKVLDIFRRITNEVQLFLLRPTRTLMS
jgi:DNA-directed RNA polymerase III subunit RPC1